MLASSKYVVLFDSMKRVIFLHDQNEKADLIIEVNVGSNVQPGMKMARDNTNYVTFHNVLLD